MKILVIGGGIGGLAVALALARTGQQVTVYERTSEIKEVGAGLTVWPNAVRVLQQLGLTEVLPSLGMPAHYRTIRTWQGKTLSRIHVDDISGSPIQVMHRADLQGALLRAVEAAGVPVELGKQCNGFTQDAGGVEASFADGTTAKGDLLIGADGIRSIVRQQLFGPPRIHYAGYSSWRGIASLNRDLIPFGISSETWGIGRRIGLIPLKDERVYWFVARTVPERDGKDEAPEKRKQRVQALFRGWHDPIEQVLEATEASMIIHADVYAIAPLTRWSEGRVVLVGDAAHAMAPNMGQGGCQAIEDAPVLAECLQAHATDIPTALRAYEMKRIPRVKRVADRSEWIGWLSQVNNPFWYGLRNVLVNALYTTALTRELTWLLQSS
ncbi:MAG: FAD-dependent monooxygenase [Ktedonobacteraceae bacterium]|nr:FAD-dependent monooxygenase [Ktedonobacteraceae bacterium]